MKMPVTIQTKDLQLGDTVQLSMENPWTFAIVEEIDNISNGSSVRFATLFRPYGTMADFDMGNKIITYIGTEKFKLPMNSSPIVLWQRRKKDVRP